MPICQLRKWPPVRIPGRVYRPVRPLVLLYNSMGNYNNLQAHLTTSTAPALTLGSLPMMDTLAVKEPSMLKTTHSHLGGTMAR